MDSVILEGIDALKAAKWIGDYLGQEAYSLEPDFVMTARLYVPSDPLANWITTIERWRDLENTFGYNKHFRAIPDGPPYRMGSEESVTGTLL